MYVDEYTSLPLVQAGLYHSISTDNMLAIIFHLNGATVWLHGADVNV